MKFKSLICLIVLIFLFSSCVTNQSRESTEISQVVFSLAQTAVFEIVVIKPVEDLVIYERDLDWSLVPFSIRSDNYQSIGTAFAISRTEVITAFHVINLGFKSMAYDQFFIRDRNGDVFEIDQIIGGSNEKDYLIFTVKDRTFDTFFEFDRNFREGQLVYSIGNALGEGIVIRAGHVLGVIPEEDSGRWNLIKTSADGNPGNSGGPLVNSSGKVVALLISRQDNILYSTPSSVILDSSRSKLDYRLKLTYAHFILSNRLTRIFETSLPLPQTYQNIREQLVEEYRVEYDIIMTTLFKNAPVYLIGPNNRLILNSILTSVFPQVDFINADDDEWTLSNLSGRNYNLIDDGILMHQEVTNWNFYKLNKPRSMSLEESFEPRYIMDTILQNIRLNRIIGNENFRMLSFGDPKTVSSYTDFLGRTWLTAHWLIRFADRILIMHILPLPNGPIVITTMQTSSQQEIYEWDMKKINDHIWASYFGTFEDWNKFLTTDFVPDFLEDFDFDWQESTRQISFNTKDISFSASNNVHDWTSNSQLVLGPSHYLLDSEIHYGIRRITLFSNPRQREGITIIKRISPDPRMPRNIQENWNDIIQERFPFNGVSAISPRDNDGSVGAVLLPPSGNPNLRYTLFLSIENPKDDDHVLMRFNELKHGVRIRD